MKLNLSTLNMTGPSFYRSNGDDPRPAPSPSSLGHPTEITRPPYPETAGPSQSKDRPNKGGIAEKACL